jgi:hypothetical protein
MKLTKVRDLHLAASSGGGFLSAASGLVKHAGRLYVVADDELHLCMFKNDKPGRRRRLLSGELPADHKARKKAKPDFEVLLALAPSPDLPHGALLALGSGSTENRCRGVLIPFTATGLARQTIRFDLAPLYQSLGQTIPYLNIEGAVARADDLLLFHRGNNAHPDNLVISVGLTALLTSVAAGDPANPPVHAICALPIGDIAGVPLSVTDAALLPDGGLIVTAVCEDTGNAYDDGKLLGSAVCRLDSRLKLVGCWMLDPMVKVEGVELDGDDILLVTDADDPSRPAELFRAKLPQV